MHFSAKRDRMSSICLSLCPSVTLVDCDHIGRNSSKTISRLLAWGDRSLQTQTSGVYSKRNTRKFWPKVTQWFERRRHSIANCGRMVTDSATVSGHNGEPIWNRHRSFEWWHRWSPTTSPYHPNGGSICPKIREWPYLRNGWSDTLHVLGFSGSTDRMALFPV